VLIDLKYSQVLMYSDTSLARFKRVATKSASIPFESITFDTESNSIDMVSMLVDNDSMVIDLLSTVIDNDTMLIDLPPEVVDKSSSVIDKSSTAIDLMSEVLDNGSEVIDKNYNLINSMNSRARQRSHPFAVRHICCPQEANALTQRHQKSLPARPSPP